MYLATCTVPGSRRSIIPDCSVISLSLMRPPAHLETNEIVIYYSSLFTFYSYIACYYNYKLRMNERLMIN